VANESHFHLIQVETDMAQTDMATLSRGKFITIEGQDGAGKSTNLDVIEAFLQENNIDYIKTREPGGTQFSEAIRELLLNSDDNVINDHAELMLIFAARAQHIEELIEPALKKGVWVLCDRFTDTTYAYQGGGRGIDKEVIADLEKTIQGDLQPDLTVLLDLPVELGESRAGQRSDPDRFERQQKDFKKKVRDVYLTLACTYPKRIKIINARDSIKEVESSVRQVLINFMATLTQPD